MHCNAVGWITPEGYRLNEANALLMLRVAANQAAKKLRGFTGNKEAGGDSSELGPSEYYVPGRYNGD